MTDWDAHWKPGDPIGYIRSEIPELKDPPYSGERYEAMVPDTLDLAERARLAVHAMTENPNPLADYEAYWRIRWLPVPRMIQDIASPGITAKFQEAVSLCRLMSGSDQNLHVDKRWMEVTLKQQGPDGLIYVPIEGRPWAYAAMRQKPNLFSGVEGGELDESATQIIHPVNNGLALRNMCLYAARDGGDFWHEPIRGVVDGLTELAIEHGQYAYFWPGPIWAVKDPPPDVKPRYHFHSPEVCHPIWGLVRAYATTGYEPAQALARKLIAFDRATCYTPEGAWVTPQVGAVKGQTIIHARGTRAMAELALTTKDEELLEFVVRSYEWARSRTEPLTGFIGNLVSGPLWPGPAIDGEQDPSTDTSFHDDALNPCEVGGLGPLIAVAVQLSEAGAGDYWDDADRWTRNMIAESQLLSTDWVYHLPGALTNVPMELVPGQTIDRVAERNLGSWPTASLPHDWYEGPPINANGFVHGDTPNVGRSIYWVWDSILRYRDGRLKVNLLLNRASQWADVNSYLPYQGRVEIKVKQPVDLAVRIPEWVTSRDTRVCVNGEDRRVEWDGKYARVGGVKPGDTAVLEFPMAEETVEVGIEKRRYTLVRRGNEVVDIYPRGQFYPYYRREHYRSGEPRWRKVARYVTDRPINW